MSINRLVNEVYVSLTTEQLSCSHCLLKSSDPLFRCKKCNAVEYCSEECQTLHREKHLKHCDDIVERYVKLSEAADRVRHFSVNGDRTVNLFETAVGYFKGDETTRDYCSERLSLMLTLRWLGGEHGGNVLALILATEHLLDLIFLQWKRLRQENNSEIADKWSTMLASLYLKQNRCAAAHTVINWFIFTPCQWDKFPFTNCDDCRDDLIDESLTKMFTSVKGAATEISLLSIYLNVKCQLFQYVSECIATRDILIKKFNAFLLGCHQRLGEKSHILRVSRCYPALRLIYEYTVPKCRRKELASLEKQIRELISRINDLNKYVIPGFIYRDALIKMPAPMRADSGSVEEAFMVVAATGHEALPCLKEPYMTIQSISISELKLYSYPKTFRAASNLQYRIPTRYSKQFDD